MILIEFSYFIGACKLISSPKYNDWFASFSASQSPSQPASNRCQSIRSTFFCHLKNFCTFVSVCLFVCHMNIWRRRRRRKQLIRNCNAIGVRISISIDHIWSMNFETNRVNIRIGVESDEGSQTPRQTYARILSIQAHSPRNKCH